MGLVFALKLVKSALKCFSIHSIFLAICTCSLKHFNWLLKKLTGQFHRHRRQLELQAHDGLHVVQRRLRNVESVVRRQDRRRRLRRDVPPLQFRQRHLRANAETISRL